MVLELKNTITATEREYLLLQVHRLVFFLKHSSSQAAGSPTEQVEFKGANMVFRVNVFIINRKENTWVGSQL